MNRRDAIKSAVCGAAAIFLGPLVAKTASAHAISSRWHYYWVLTTFHSGGAAVSFYHTPLDAYRAKRAIQTPQRKPPVIEKLVFYGSGLYHEAKHIRLEGINDHHLRT